MADARDFLLNTDHEMDKIIYFTSGEIMPGETDFIYHDFDFTPLVFGVGAFQSDFSDPKMSPYLQWTANGSINFQFWVADYFIGLSYNNSESSNQKLYYRLYAFEPSNTTSTIQSTSSEAEKFVLNTDYNYCKLFKKGIAEGTTTIVHNLGYIPLVLAWDEGAFVIPHWWNDANNNISVTSNEVKIRTDASSKTHYRIYYDEV